MGEFDNLRTEETAPPRRRRAPSWWGHNWWWVAMASTLAASALACGGVVAWKLMAMLARENARPPVTYARMTADQFIDEWKANPARAAKKYASSGAEITGKLKVINSNIHGDTYIELHGEKDGLPRSAHIFVTDDRALKGLERCKVGGVIVVKARSTGTVHNTPWLIADDISPR